MKELGTVEIMTVGLAKDLIRACRGNGYMKPSLDNWDGAYVRCPLCTGDIPLIERPYARRWKTPSAAEWQATHLRHLTDPYADSRCPQVRSVRAGSEWRG